MIKNENKKPRRISADLLAVDIEVIKTYIKGAVHGFCNNNAEENFSVRSLFGGENTLWYDTPLQKIYDYHVLKGCSYEKAAKQAGKDVGLLLRLVLIEDKKFEYEQINAFTKEYRRLKKTDEQV